jgi:hypothetical protein
VLVALSFSYENHSGVLLRVPFTVPPIKSKFTRIRRLRCLPYSQKLHRSDTSFEGKSFMMLSCGRTNKSCDGNAPEARSSTPWKHGKEGVRITKSNICCIEVRTVYCIVSSQRIKHIIYIHEAIIKRGKTLFSCGPSRFGAWRGALSLTQ